MKNVYVTVDTSLQAQFLFLWFILYIVFGGNVWYLCQGSAVTPTHHTAVLCLRWSCDSALSERLADCTGIMFTHSRGATEQEHNYDLEEVNHITTNTYCHTTRCHPHLGCCVCVCLLAGWLFGLNSWTEFVQACAALQGQRLSKVRCHATQLLFKDMVLKLSRTLSRQRQQTD